MGCTFQQSRTRGELGGRCKTLVMAQLRHVMVIAGFSKVNGAAGDGLAQPQCVTGRLAVCF
jgi:hypothetical protein